MDIPLAAKLHVEQSVLAESFEHMVEKSDSSIDVVIASAVNFERDADLCLFGISLYGGHLNPSLQRHLCSYIF
ncbi:hypothetical protein D1872_318360 [compost metagenome]